MVLLLVAASSSAFRAGPGLLKALARERVEDDEATDILPELLGLTNRYHTPYWSVLVGRPGGSSRPDSAGGRTRARFLLCGLGLFELPSGYPRYGRVLVPRG